jgi:uncharacterized membrane protein YdbT with pleckstrin-like domain
MRHAARGGQSDLSWTWILSALLGVVTLPLLIPLYFRYHTLRYRFDDQGLSMGYGVLFRREMHITYARMQDIHLSQNLLERWLGIGTVTVQTAGAGAGGDLRIVGVKRFEQIRDYLYERMRGVREHSRGASELSLLAEIRDSLHVAAAALAKESL